MATTCLSGTLPGPRHVANQASGHLSQQLAAVRECVINEQLAKARGSACCARPYISSASAPLASAQLVSRCSTVGVPDNINNAVLQARDYTVANSGSITGTAPSNSVYMKRKMDMLSDPRLQTLAQQKEDLYNKVYPPRVIDTCPPPQVVAHAGEGIPTPFFKCALLNILVSN